MFVCLFRLLALSSGIKVNPHQPGASPGKVGFAQGRLSCSRVSKTLISFDNLENLWKSSKTLEHLWKPFKTLENLENLWKSLKTFEDLENDFSPPCLPVHFQILSTLEVFDIIGQVYFVLLQINSYVEHNKKGIFAAPTVKKEKNQDQTPAGKKPLDKISLRGTLMLLFFLQ